MSFRILGARAAWSPWPRRYRSGGGGRWACVGALLCGVLVAGLQIDPAAADEAQVTEAVEAPATGAPVIEGVEALEAEAPALVPSALPSQPRFAVDFDASSQTLRALVVGEERWRHRLGSPDVQAATLCGPEMAQGALWYAYGQQAWKVEDVSGRVLARWSLDGRCVDWAAEGDALVLVTESASGEVAWTRRHTFRAGAAPPRMVPSFSLGGFMQLERAARAGVPSELVSRLDHPPQGETLDPSESVQLDGAIDAWLARLERDDTDPWVLYYAMAGLAWQGRAEASRALHPRFAAVDAGWELARVSHRLRAWDAALADEALARALTGIEANGFVGRLNLSALPVVVALGEGPAVDAAWDEHRRWAEGLARVGPRAEGAHAYWRGYASLARQRGQADDAAWAARYATLAHANRYFGAWASSDGWPMDLWMHLLLAAVLFLPGLSLLHVVRGLGHGAWRASQPALTRYNPLAWFPRSVVAGLLLTLLVGGISAWSFGRAISAVGKLAAAPSELIAGLPAHPASTTYLAPYAAGHPAVAAWLAASEDPSALLGDDVAADAAMAHLQAAFLEISRPSLSLRTLLGSTDAMAHLQADALVWAEGAQGMVWLAVICALLLLLALVSPRRGGVPLYPADRARAWRVLELVLPGLSPRLGVVGPLLALAWGFALLCWLWLVFYGSQGGLGPLEAIGTPSFERIYGPVAGVGVPSGQGVSWVWWVLPFGLWGLGAVLWWREGGLGAETSGASDSPHLD